MIPRCAVVPCSRTFLETYRVWHLPPHLHRRACADNTGRLPTCGVHRHRQMPACCLDAITGLVRHPILQYSSFHVFKVYIKMHKEEESCSNKIYWEGYKDSAWTMRYVMKAESLQSSDSSLCGYRVLPPVRHWRRAPLFPHPNRFGTVF